MRTASPATFLTVNEPLVVAATGVLDHRAGFISLFNGLTNDGNIDLSSSLQSFGGEVLNRNSLDVLAGGELALAGGAVRNQRLMTITGGTVSGNLVNEAGASLLARGTIGGASNAGTLETTGLLTVTSTLNNTGSVLVGSAETLQFVGSSMLNGGLVQLTGGGALTGVAAQFGPPAMTNTPAGVLRGDGSVALPLTNDGGLVEATAGGTFNLTDLRFNFDGGELRVDDGATMIVGSAFSQVGTNGTIDLRGPGSVLGGTAVIANSGSIGGQGRIANRVLNNAGGEIRATGGRLTLAAANSTNDAGAAITADGAGAEVFFTQGLTTNAGQIALLGGSFHNNGKPLSNTGLIDGHGTLRTGGLTNTGTLSVGGGDLDVLGTVQQRHRRRRVGAGRADAPLLQQRHRRRQLHRPRHGRVPGRLQPGARARGRRDRRGQLRRRGGVRAGVGHDAGPCLARCIRPGRCGWRARRRRDAASRAAERLHPRLLADL